ncbi:MAG: NAD-dependent epimerase/dehydratase family protein [Nanoarchaeota archaeon]
MKNILITGSTGFIGKHFVKEAVKKYKVRCLFSKTKPEFKENVELVHGNLLDKNSLIDAAKNIDYVVHLAAAVQSINKNTNYSVNVLGTKNLIEACQLNSVKKIIHFSSVNATFKELGIYGNSKLQSEIIVKNSKIPFVIIRPAMIYGKGDKGLTMTYNLLRKHSIIPVIGDAEIRPVYIDDIISIIMKVLESKIALNKTYYIGGATKLTIKEYMKKIGRLTPGSKKYIKVPAWPFKFIIKVNEALGMHWLMTHEQYLSMTQKQRALDIGPAEKDLNFKPLDFDTGLKLWIKEVKN